MLHLPKVLHFTMSLLNTQNSPDEKLLREANYMAPPFFSLPIYSIYSSNSGRYHVSKEGKGISPQKLTKVEYAISHSHLISLCVYTYVFYWILNAVIILFNPMRSKYNYNLKLYRLEEWESSSDLPKVTKLKYNRDEKRKQFCLTLETPS